MEQITPRFDQIDRDRFKDMVESPPFQVLTKRIQTELERARGIAERHDSSIKQIRVAQGTVAALRTVLALPNQILNDMKAKSK